MLPSRGNIFSNLIINRTIIHNQEAFGDTPLSSHNTEFTDKISIDQAYGTVVYFDQGIIISLKQSRAYVLYP
jgi:hypothetical protein